MMQLGARHYWPEVGRFVQQDPIRDGMNWYAYAGNRPTVAIDPEGEKWWKWRPKWWPFRGRDRGRADRCPGDDSQPVRPPASSIRGVSPPQMGIGQGKPHRPDCDNRAPRIDDCKECLRFPGDPAIAQDACAACCTRGAINKMPGVQECFLMCNYYINER